MAATLRIFSCLLVLSPALASNKFRTVHEWSSLEFQFPDDAVKEAALRNMHYIPGESFIIDMDVHYRPHDRPRLFVTIPRFGAGRPMTLGVVTKESGRGGPLVKPYPDYSWHENQGTNCDGMTSVLRIAIDECSRLWVLDTGKINEDQVCPPQLLAFNLHDDSLILRHKFHIASPTVVKQASLFATPVVDVRDPKNGCKNTFVYIADVTGFQIVVYDMATDSAWKAENKFMFPHPERGTFNIVGETFELMDGILGMALSPFRNPEQDRILFFHALASVTENAVRTSVLRNATAWGDFPSASPREFVQLQMRRKSQAAAQAMDRNGILFFGLASLTAIGCWDSNTAASPSSIPLVAEDVETLQFASGVKVVTNSKGYQELWVITCRFQKIMTGTMNSTEVNFRIMAANTMNLVQGTKCSRHRDDSVNINQIEDNFSQVIFP